ncbi:MAG: hypothetical protein AB1410_01215 [Acidobacteriota bacterium]
MLRIKPSEQSLDYVKNKKEFHLHNLITEQRHPKTWSLSFRIKSDTSAGLEMLFSVDKDISAKILELSENSEKIEQAVEAVEKAIIEKRKIYIYGCGATGRLAKQMESTFWRPFWRKLKSSPLWEKIKIHLAEGVEEQLIGEMTGGDRALISSLEGFEDLQLIGYLQLKDRGIEKGDVVFCVTEGGETSSVIGTILAALNQYGKLDKEKIEVARKNLYFIYNNPDEVLIPFERSRAVIENPAITKINLATGHQAITGSTRMQATTIETFVMGIILEEAIYLVLQRFLTESEMFQLGFSPGLTIEERLKSFNNVLESVLKARNSLASFTDLEAETYKNQRFLTYFAQKGLITVFIDSTERSPTFRLFPLDTVMEPERRCWIQVWTPAGNLKEAWKSFLGRPFRGLNPSIYEAPFSTDIKDPFLKEAALKSLKHAGNDQENLYDFSFSDFNIKNRSPKEGDLGVVVCMGEEVDKLKEPSFPFRRFISFFKERKANVVLLLITDKQQNEVHEIIQNMKEIKGKDVSFILPIGEENDPIGLRQNIGLKMLLNAHSTAVMAKLGRVIGNTMTNVSPSNLKLIGRATYLIQSHVNDALSQDEWIEKYGRSDFISYEEANAVLFDAIEFIKKDQSQSQTAEVALSIIRILEALRKKDYVSWNDAFSILETEGFEKYLLTHNPSLRR